MKFATIKNVLLTAFVASANAYDLLKDFSGDLKVGVAANSMKFSNSNYVDAMKAFNMMVAENACKLSGIQQQKGNYNFKDCDAHYDKAKELGMEFRGHTLVWHAYMPQWFEGADASTLKNAIVDHITTVLKHYEGKIKTWDVVNEAVDDSSNGNGFQLRNSFLRQKVPDFVDLAFQTARKVSPDTKLFYNDYNAEGQYPKSESIYNFVADLKKRNIPIDGVGLQYHVGSNSQPSFDKINDLIGRYCKLGLEVHITELDVKKEGNESRQTEAYTNALKACLGNSCCKAFLVWGVGDSDSWLGANEEALLFNNNYQPKPVYNSLIEVLKKEAKPANAATEEKTTAAAAENKTAESAEKSTKVYKTGTNKTKTIPESLLTKTQSKTKTIPSVTTVPATKTLPTSKFTKTLPDTKKTKTLPNTTKTIPSAPITKNTTKTEEASNNASATRTTKTVPQSILDMIAAKTIPSSLLTNTKTKTIPSSLLTKTKTIPSSLLTKTDGAEPTTTEAGTTEVTNGAASATRTTKTVPQSILDMIKSKSLSKTQKETTTAVNATKTVPDIEVTSTEATTTEAATTEVSSVEATSAVKTTKTVPQSILDMIKSKSLSATQKGEATTIVSATKTIPDISTKTLPDTQATECNECAGSNQNNINIKNDNSTTNNININNNNITNNNTTNNITNNNITNTNNTNNTSNNNNINNYYYYYTTIVDGNGNKKVTSEIVTTSKTDLPPDATTKKIPDSVVPLIITKSISANPIKTTTVSATKTIPDTVITNAAENPITTPKKNEKTKTLPTTVTKTIPSSLITPISSISSKKTVTCTKTRTQKAPVTDPSVPVANPTVEPINEPIPGPIDEPANPVDPKPTAKQTGKKTTQKVTKTTPANKTVPANGQCSCEPVTVTVTVTEKPTETTAAPVDAAAGEETTAPKTPSTGKAVTGEIQEGEDEVPNGKCSRRFARCGGINYKGPKCCQSGSRCYYINRWLSQCL